MASREKLAKSNYERYRRSTYHSLNDCYATHSAAKEQAWSYCLNLMRTKNGHDLRVLSANTYMFTAGFEFEDEEGVCKFMYITPSYNTEVEV